MKSKYTVLISVVLFLGLIYYFVSYQTKAKTIGNRQSEQSLQESVNKNVRLQGKAANSKTGAVLLVGNDQIYIEGLDQWLKNIVDKQVSISGKLVIKSFVPQAEISKNGEISQGGSGDEDYVLEDVDLGKYK
jgi:hypothetical protein